MIYTVIDIETSGLSRENADVLSFSYALTDGKEILAADTLYFWTDGMQWSQESYEIHGLSKEFLSQYKDDFDKNLRAMFSVVQDSVLVGYNSGYMDKFGVLHGFDYQVIKNFLLRNMLDFPIPSSFVDLLKIARSRETNAPNKKLQSIVDYYGISREAIARVNDIVFPESKAVAHNSGYDVVCTVYILKEMLAKDLIEVTTNFRQIVANDFQFVMVGGVMTAVYNDSVVYSFAEFVNEFPVIYTQIFGGILNV